MSFQTVKKQIKMETTGNYMQSYKDTQNDQQHIEPNFYIKFQFVKF